MRTFLKISFSCLFAGHQQGVGGLQYEDLRIWLSMVGGPLDRLFGSLDHGLLVQTQLLRIPCISLTVVYIIHFSMDLLLMGSSVAG